MSLPQDRSQELVFERLRILAMYKRGSQFSSSHAAAGLRDVYQGDLDLFNWDMASFSNWFWSRIESAVEVASIQMRTMHRALTANYEVPVGDLVVTNGTTARLDSLGAGLLRLLSQTQRTAQEVFYANMTFARSAHPGMQLDGSQFRELWKKVEAAESDLRSIRGDVYAEHPITAGIERLIEREELDADVLIRDLGSSDPEGRRRAAMDVALRAASFFEEGAKAFDRQVQALRRKEKTSWKPLSKLIDNQIHILFPPDSPDEPLVEIAKYVKRQRIEQSLADIVSTAAIIVGFAVMLAGSGGLAGIPLLVAGAIEAGVTLGGVLLLIRERKQDEPLDRTALIDQTLRATPHEGDLTFDIVVAIGAMVIAVHALARGIQAMRTATLAAGAGGVSTDTNAARNLGRSPSSPPDATRPVSSPPTASAPASTAPSASPPASSTNRPHEAPGVARTRDLDSTPSPPLDKQAVDEGLAKAKAVDEGNADSAWKKATEIAGEPPTKSTRSTADRVIDDRGLTPEKMAEIERHSEEWAADRLKKLSFDRNEVQGALSLKRGDYQTAKRRLDKMPDSPEKTHMQREVDALEQEIEILESRQRGLTAQIDEIKMTPHSRGRLFQDLTPTEGTIDLDRAVNRNNFPAIDRITPGLDHAFQDKLATTVLDEAIIQTNDVVTAADRIIEGPVSEAIRKLKGRWKNAIREFPTAKFGGRGLPSDWKKMRITVNIGLDSPVPLDMLDLERVLEEVHKRIRLMGDGIDPKLFDVQISGMRSLEVNIVPEHLMP